MKRFIIIGAILTGVAVLVLLACASAPVAKGGPLYFIVKVKLETGEIVNVADENGNVARPVPANKLEEISTRGGFKYVGTILYTHSSPGCGFVNWGGNLVYICGP